MFFANENVVEVTESAFNKVVNEEALKVGSKRLLKIVQCRYWGRSITNHLHHGWTYEGEKIDKNHFRCLDESDNWWEFRADSVKDSLFVEHRGKEWITFEDELIIRSVAELETFDNHGHLIDRN